MGEERHITGTRLFFCKTEDLGTGKVEWKEMKQVDSICLREKTSIPKLEVKEPWPTSFSFTATVENTGGILELHRKIRRNQSRRDHYIRRILPKETKDYFYKLCLKLKVHKFKKKGP